MLGFRVALDSRRRSAQEAAYSLRRSKYDVVSSGSSVANIMTCEALPSGGCSPMRRAGASGRARRAMDPPMWLGILSFCVSARP